MAIKTYNLKKVRQVKLLRGCHYQNQTEVVMKNENTDKEKAR